MPADLAVGHGLTLDILALDIWRSMLPRRNL
jgi:hypothetical protein